MILVFFLSSFGVFSCCLSNFHYKNIEIYFLILSNGQKLDDRFYEQPWTKSLG